MRRRTRTTRTLQSAAALNDVFKNENTCGCAVPNHWFLIGNASLARTSSQGRRKSGAKRERWVRNACRKDVCRRGTKVWDVVQKCSTHRRRSNRKHLS